MKKVIVIVLFLLGYNFSSAQSECIRGNCKDNFSFQNFERSYQVGFYKDGKLEGFGVQVDSTSEYFGNFIKGKKEGLFYYVKNKEAIYGSFKNDLPIGLHVARIVSGYDYRNYNDEGEMVSKSPPVVNEVTVGCIQGDCMNGYGVVNQDDNFFAGNYIDGKLQGNSMLYRTEEKRIIYCEMKAGVFNGTCIVYDFDGTINLYNMAPTREGQSFCRTKDLKYKGFLYKNNEIIEKY